MYLSAEFLAVTLVSILAVISPGPDFIIVTRNSLLYSKRAGLYTALGITVGTTWWIVASLLGISYLIAEATVIFNLLKWAGAGYLIYLGVKSLLAKAPASTTEEEVKQREDLSPLTAFKIGFLTNLLNPKAALFFVSFFSVILTPTTSLPIKMLYGGQISLIALIWFSLLSTVLSIGGVKSIFRRIQVWVERLTGAILIGLGVKLALADSK